MEPVTPDFLSVLFPMSIVMQEVSPERWIEIPEPVREIYRLWRPTPMCRALRLEKALDDARAHLLQEREREPGRLAQAEHGRRAGLLQQGGRDEGAHDGDGRRPVGLGARDGLQLLRAGPRDLHGQGLVPPEALPPAHHGELRRAGLREPDGPHAIRPEGPRRDARLAGLARDGDLRGRRGGGDERRREEVQPRLGPRPRPHAPDGHRPRGSRADGDGGGVSRTS